MVDAAAAVSSAAVGHSNSTLQDEPITTTAQPGASVLVLLSLSCCSAGFLPRSLPPAGRRLRAAAAASGRPDSEGEGGAAESSRFRHSGGRRRRGGRIRCRVSCVCVVLTLRAAASLSGQRAAGVDGAEEQSRATTRPGATQPEAAPGPQGQTSEGGARGGRGEAVRACPLPCPPLRPCAVACLSLRGWFGAARRGGCLRLRSAHLCAPCVRLTDGAHQRQH
jgi:hypothetical protein